MSVIDIVHVLSPVMQDIGDAVEAVSDTSPLLGAIVIMLVTAIVGLTGALIYVFKLYRTENEKKEEEIRKLNEFIRSSYKETTSAISDIIHVIDVLTSTTESVSADVKTEIREFMLEIRTHISTLQNLPSIIKSQLKNQE